MCEKRRDRENEWKLEREGDRKKIKNKDMEIESEWKNEKELTDKDRY